MLVMDKPIPSQQPSPARSRMVHAPQRSEGIGNALRSVFDPGSYGLPESMTNLLAKLDGK
jgi:hypothetical protein